MSLYTTEFKHDDRTHLIVCEDTASGLDGVDGKAWHFTVTDALSQQRADMVSGVESELLHVWHEQSGTEIDDMALITLLADRLKLLIRRGTIDVSSEEAAADSQTTDVLKPGDAAGDFAEERRGLDSLLAK